MEELLDSPDKTKYKVRYAALITWASLLLVGLMFRVMHWPFASILILCSSAAFSAFTFSKVLFITKLKNTLLVVILVLCSIWILVMLWGAFFNYGHPYNFKGVSIYFTAFAVLFLIHSLINFSIRRRLR